MTNHTDPTNPDPLPSGTRVLNTDDGEPGTILNGYYRNAAGDWTEYEVVVGPTIEIWSRDGFALMSDLEAAVEAAR